MTHLPSLYVPEQELVLAEAKVYQEENEIVVAPKILKQVILKRVIVRRMPCNTQRKNCQRILPGGGEYIWMVKGNQASALWAIQKLFVHEASDLNNGASLSKDIRTTEIVN